MKTKLLTAAICFIATLSVNLAYGYHPVSPYAYCLNNPVKYVDPKGEDVWEINNMGEIVNRIKDKTQDAFYMVNSNNQRMQDANGVDISISFKYGTVVSQNTNTFSSNGNTGNYDVYQVRGDGNGTALFEFMANNVTGATGVEVGQTMTGVAGAQGINYITTSHEVNRESGGSNLFSTQLYNGYTIREMNHSHPSAGYPSGLPGTKEFGRSGDITKAQQVTNYMINNSLPVPQFNIYHVPTRTMIPYGPNSIRSQFK